MLLYLILDAEDLSSPKPRGTFKFPHQRSKFSHYRTDGRIAAG